MQVLWGLGKSGPLAVVMTAAAVLTITLNFLLIPMYGPVASVFAMIAGLTIATTLSLWIATEKAGLKLSILLRRDVLSLLPAGLACAAGATLVVWPLQVGGDLWRLTLGAVFGSVAYAIAITFTKSLAEERMVLQGTLAMISNRFSAAIRSSRRRAKNVSWLRSAWYLLIVMRRRLVYRSASTSASLDELFEAKVDPWDYHSAVEQVRHAIAETLLSQIDDPDAFDRVLEIGCAEGAFTQRLAGRCQSLLSVDVSANALARARLRCAGERSVRFSQLDLLRDQIDGQFTLAIAMDVLTYFESVSHLRALRSKIIGVIEPGGWLLIGDVRQSEVYESSWWGRRLLCGGLRICEFMAAHPQLTEVSRVQTDTHVLLLLRKTR
jgi:predicted TPR repeat methyltransferase